MTENTLVSPGEELGEISINKSDVGNARRFVDYHGKRLRYIAKWKQWLIWDGKRWKPDEMNEIARLAKDVPRIIYKEASKLENTVLRKSLIKWGLQTENSSRLANLIKEAQTEPGIPISPDELDADPFLLGCMNGILDLRECKLLSYSPDRLLTKQIPVAFDPLAQCPTWLAFLDTITGGNKRLQGFLQRAIGYSLTGDTREQVLFFMHGIGANGKSTFINTIKTLLGDYAKQTPTETLMRKDSSGVSNDLAALKGARLIAAVETDEGQRLAESLIKQITGGDMISARFLYTEFFEFMPSFKVWLAGNHKPAIRGTDHGIWRRVRLIPFEVIIPEEKRDRQLPEKLKAELPGILEWAVQGCYEWQAGGLGTPPEVMMATESYRLESDIIALFLEEYCVVKPGIRVGNAELYKAYREWCEEAGEMHSTQRKFTQRLKERGFIQGTGGKRLWDGIGIKANILADEKAPIILGAF